MRVVAEPGDRRASGGSTPPTPVRIVDIGTGGLGVLQRAFRYPGTRCEIDLRRQNGATLRIRVEVRSCIYVGDGQHRLGVRAEERIPLQELQGAELLTDAIADKPSTALARIAVAYADENILERRLFEAAVADSGCACSLFSSVGDLVRDQEAACRHEIVVLDIPYGGGDIPASIQQLRAAGFIGPVLVASSMDAAFSDPELGQRVDATVGKPFTDTGLLRVLGELATAYNLIGIPERLTSARAADPRVASMLPELQELAKAAQAQLLKAVLADDSQAVFRIAGQLKSTAGGLGFEAVLERTNAAMPELANAPTGADLRRVVLPLVHLARRLAEGEGVSGPGNRARAA